MSSKSPRKGSAPVSKTPAERNKLRQNPVKVNVRAELLERPKVSSALFSRAEVGKRLTATDISKLIKKAGMKPMGGGGGGGGETETHVELSSAVPWVEGRGWLEAGGTLQSWFSRPRSGSFLTSRIGGRVFCRSGWTG